MNAVSKALWTRRLAYRRRRVHYWRVKGNIPKVRHWLDLVKEAKRHLDPPRPSSGIDVYSGDGKVDWAKVKTAHRFAYLKSSEGGDYKDSTWTKKRVKEIRAAGVQFGPYHYLRPKAGRSGAVEARFFIKTAYAAGWGRPGDLLPALDFEENGGLSPAATIRYLKQAVDEVTRLTGHKPMIYTGSYFWDDNGGGSDNWGCPLWLAAYQTTPPRLPKAWKKWTIWQHTATGRVAGVEAPNVDQNIARSLPHL